jgi:ribonuclease BN (tRNA processing enzyme)
MRLTVLGCSGTVPSATSGCSSYLLDHDGFRLLVDAGEGCVGALQRSGELYRIDAVVVSHLHADHCLGLLPYYYARTLNPDVSVGRLPVWGPAGTGDRLLRALDAGPPDRLAGCYDVRELVARRQQIGPFEVTAGRMAHPVECFGLRLEAGGRSLAYSADTGPTPALCELAAEADLLLCEASWRDGEDHPPDIHLTGSQAGEHAARAGARALVLTHIAPWVDAEAAGEHAAAAYPGPVELAAPGAIFIP